MCIFRHERIRDSTNESTDADMYLTPNHGQACKHSIQMFLYQSIRDDRRKIFRMKRTIVATWILRVEMSLRPLQRVGIRGTASFSRVFHRRMNAGYLQNGQTLDRARIVIARG